MAKGRKPERPKEERRARFAQEYAKDLNATAAAIRAGYAPKAAHVTGSRLLSDAKVRAEIDALLAKVATANQISVERTMQEIARIAYSDPRKMYREDGSMKPMHEMDDDTAAAIAGVESEELFAGRGEERVAIGFTRKVKRWDKARALDMCMAVLGMHKTVNPAQAGGLSLSINLSGGKKIR